MTEDLEEGFGAGRSEMGAAVMAELMKSKGGLQTLCEYVLKQICREEKRVGKRIGG